eukprot:CAMPEP_0180439140 /NCGR_PEP_ID=MMETSP1036_2-20121128/12431_1 /TAXON_ID=632150 /ORGANISM="Azadinium spinosum, Strain 3D9" /LENGTH=217 /DNA_ID=CAMNT_0022445263 /DNA_START=396 /DNA_END=1045 /DNA_ORIENTATION=+
MRPRRPALIAFRAVLPVVVEAIRTTPVAISPFRVVRGRRRRGPWRRGPWRRGPWCLLRRGPAAGAARSLPQVGSLLKLWLRNGLPVALEALKFAGEVVGEQKEHTQSPSRHCFVPVLGVSSRHCFVLGIGVGGDASVRLGGDLLRLSKALGAGGGGEGMSAVLSGSSANPKMAASALFDQVQDASELEAHFAGDLVCVLYQGATIIAPLPTNHFEQV